MSCGQNCQCAQADEATCEVNTSKEITPDENGKCPCGREMSDCCHA